MNYWVVEYIKVFITYFLVMYLWPTVVFKKHLSGKNRTYRFGFCSIVTVLLFYTVIILLGLVHILYNWLVFILFYGVFFIQLFRGYKLPAKAKEHFRFAVQGTMKPKSYFLDVFHRVTTFLSQIIKKWWKSLYGIKAESFFLLLIVAYGMLMFGYATYSAHSFGFSDLYVHHSWVYGLRIGKIFYRGIYPEAMHCFAYLLSVVFPIRTYSILVYLGAVHIFTILISCYIFFKELFCWKYSAHCALILFLLADSTCVNMAVSYARMQCSLPQEFAMGAQFLIPAFLIRYLKSRKRIRIKNRRLRFYSDENLLIFVCALAESIVVHFYGTGMAFYLCVPIAIVFLPNVLNYRRFVPLFTAVIAAVLITVIPMALAYAEGIPFQGSIGWGLNVIKGSAAVFSSSAFLTRFPSYDTGIINHYLSAGLLGAVENSCLYHFFYGLFEKIRDNWAFYTSVIHYAGYYTIFTDKLAEPIRYASMISAGLGVFLHVIIKLVHLLKKKKKRSDKYDGYIILPFMSFVYIFMFIAPLIGVPELIARSRLLVTIQMLSLAIFIVPVDFMVSLLGKRLRNWVSASLGILAMSACIYGIFRFDMYHANMYFELARYNSNVDVTNRIMKEFPKQHFTIISTTDELYQINEDGYHEEMLDFIWKQLDSHYTIPTPYIFVYVEKHSIWRGQYYEFSAPFWIASDVKESIMPIISKEPDIAYTEISKEYAEMPRPNKKLASRAAINHDYRAIMNSKVYQWVQKFKSLHPNDISVYYEDDDFVCYMITQNPARLFELSLK